MISYDALCEACVAVYGQCVVTIGNPWGQWQAAVRLPSSELVLLANGDTPNAAVEALAKEVVAAGLDRVRKALRDRERVDAALVAATEANEAVERLMVSK